MSDRTLVEEERNLSERETLEEWLESHHDPKWKYKPYRASKSRVVPRPPHAELTRDMVQYEYSVNMDRRTIHEPVSLERFMELKHDPKWKPKTLAPKRTTLRKLSTSEARRLAAEWAAEVARLSRDQVAA